MQINKITQILLKFFGMLALTIIFLVMKSPVLADTVKTFAETIMETTFYKDVILNKQEPFDYYPNKAIMLYYLEGKFKCLPLATIWSEEFNQLVEKWFFIPIDNETMWLLYEEHMRINCFKLTSFLGLIIFSLNYAKWWIIWSDPAYIEYAYAVYFSMGPW